MITETATPEGLAGSRREHWARWAGRLGGALAFLVVGGLVGLLLLTAVMPRLSGYQTYVIYGSSMEPTIKVGSLILAKPAEVDGLEVGDIIAFQSPGNGVTVTHRIVGVREENGQHYFRTKGDASNGGDPQEVRLEDGVQELAYDLPYLGYFLHFAKSTTGMILLLVLPAAGLLALHWTKNREAGANNQETVGEG
ncbi:MAG: signal peptidase I [Dehalococcoidia bacterium]|nr:signal peptidase I [Dehalococcoidia bacterium]